MGLRTYKDAQRFRHLDLLLRNGSASGRSRYSIFLIFLVSGAICALIATLESSATTLSQWVH
jgi:hypothetical protein